MSCVYFCRVHSLFSVLFGCIVPREHKPHQARNHASSATRDIYIFIYIYLSIMPVVELDLINMC